MGDALEVFGAQQRSSPHGQIRAAGSLLDGFEESPAETGHHIGTNVVSGFSRTLALVMELIEVATLADRMLAPIRK